MANSMHSIVNSRARPHLRLLGQGRRSGRFATERAEPHGQPDTPRISLRHRTDFWSRAGDIGRVMTTKSELRRLARRRGPASSSLAPAGDSPRRRGVFQLLPVAPVRVPGLVACHLLRELVIERIGELGDVAQGPGLAGPLGERVRPQAVRRARAGRTPRAGRRRRRGSDALTGLVVIVPTATRPRRPIVQVMFDPRSGPVGARCRSFGLLLVQLTGRGDRGGSELYH